MQVNSSVPLDINSGFFFDFGTLRIIFGTHSKVRYETKIEFCIREYHPAYEKDSDMCHNPDPDSLSGFRTTTTGYPLSEERAQSSGEIA